MTQPSQESTGSILTGAIQTLPLDPVLREDMGRALTAICSPRQVLYALIICGRRLVTLVQPRDVALQLRSTDLLLFINFIASQPAFRQAESWTPLCLPRFNDTGFLYSYVGYLDVPKEVCLLLVSANDDPEQFKVR